MDCSELLKKIGDLPLSEKISVINNLKIELHKISPFKNEPVDCVLWVDAGLISANNYNPNVVAPPEMELLKTSIESDGYTQPIVSWKTEDGYEVIDGFHRNRIGKEYEKIKSRIHGYLPVTIVNTESTERNKRIASTIRHNRARGKHTVDGMSEIVLELKNRNWKNERIAKELGMEMDEILRLCQITGLESLFTDQEFSKSWDIEGFADEFEPLSDDENSFGEETDEFRTVNTNDENRIFHTYDKWECYRAGFYANKKDGVTKERCEQAYADFLSDIDVFSSTLEKVIIEWKNSCEHYLTNNSMNRIAWLGQAAVCYATGVPAVFRSGFYLLSQEQQLRANQTALIYLNKWLKNNNRNEITMEEALSGSQMDLF